MGEPAGREAWSQEQLLKTVEALGEIPSVIYLMRPSLDRVLAPVCAALGIVVERVEQRHSTAEAAEFIASRMLSSRGLSGESRRPSAPIQPDAFLRFEGYWLTAKPDEQAGPDCW